MPNETHFEIIQQGVEGWNQWREDNPEIEPDLSDVDLSDLKLNNANLSDTDLRRSILKNTDFRGANLVRADLRAASISKASFNLAKLREANFSEAYIRESDLSEADLKRAYFIRADLVRVDLWETDLARADFRWAYLIGTDLKQANLTRADLRWAHLSVSNLSEANLSNANLIKASIIKTNLHHTNLQGVSMAWTHFGDVDLSLTKELYTAQHYGPSSIGIDTIMRSDGKIPETFLRETGVSDNIIQNIALLTEEGLSHQNCFISYAAKDLEVDFQQHVQARQGSQSLSTIALYILAANDPATDDARVQRGRTRSLRCSQGPNQHAAASSDHDEQQDVCGSLSFSRGTNASREQ